MNAIATAPVEITYQNVTHWDSPIIIKDIHYDNGHQLVLMWDISGYHVLVKHGTLFDGRKTSSGFEIFQYMVLYRLGTIHFVCEFYFNVLHDLLRSSMDPSRFPDTDPITVSTESPTWIAYFIRSWLSDLAPDLSPGWQSIPSWEEISEKVKQISQQGQSPSGE